MAQTQALREATTSLEAARSHQTAPGRFRVRIIEADRWGSSAYYPASVLKRDASIFKAGTHTYFDHPTMSESVERPERSVRDLAGRLLTDARFEGDGLYAEMEVFPHYREIVESMGDAIGLSIRATGTIEHGEIEGRSGPILTEFTEAASVDFVTAAGAGGKVIALLESARREMAQSDDAPEMYDPAAMAETITPAPPAQPLEENRMSGSTQQGTPTGGPTEVSEAATLRTELAETKQRLAEAELKVAQLGDQATKLAEAETALEEAKRENLRLHANDTARTKAVETLESSTLPETAHERVIDAVTGKNVPLNGEGALDEAALVTNIKAAIESERRYLTRFAEEAGIGSVRGLGSSSEPQVNVESELGDVFAALGMSESAARVAAKGRG